MCLLAERGGAAASFHPQRVPAEEDEGEAAPERPEQQLPGARPLRWRGGGRGSHQPGSHQEQIQGGRRPEGWAQLDGHICVLSFLTKVLWSHWGVMNTLLFIFVPLSTQSRGSSEDLLIRQWGGLWWWQGPEADEGQEARQRWGGCNSIQFICIAQFHKLQICLGVLYNLYT